MMNLEHVPSQISVVGKRPHSATAFARNKHVVLTMVCKLRKPWVGGNWKCNGSKSLVRDLAAKLNEANIDQTKIDAVLFPPLLYADCLRAAVDQKKYEVGFQNISNTGFGAFTGEICPEMMKEIDYKWTLIGHSERRQLYNEDDATVGSKVAACQKTGGICIAVCVGETLEQMKANDTEKVLQKQLEAIIPHVTDWSRVVIAYEPVWAIGTGQVATPEVAEKNHQFIRHILETKGGNGSVRIVYGGSVNAGNCAKLAAQPNIDGFLVGGASLKPEFVEIIKSCIT